MTHIDPPARRKPLPLLERGDLWPLVEPLLDDIVSKKGRIATSNGFIGLTLYSDSAHLIEFFSGNFGFSRHESVDQDDAIIVAFSDHYMARLPMLEPYKRYVDPERRVIVSLGAEYYGNIKVTVRGLCSSAMARRGKGSFLHGASMNVRGKGIVLSGVSGVGKTTMTRALMSLCPGDIQMINDDWGWADHDSRTIIFTGEPNLHMKYRSVRAVAPHVDLSPEIFLSENFEGDWEDPHARLLIPRDAVFGSSVTNIGSFDALIVITRDKSNSPFVRSLTINDLDLLEAAEYSAFYDRHEHFMDGSLLLLDEEDMRRERQRFADLLRRVPGVLLNNVGSPDTLAAQLLAHLGL